MTGAGVNLVGQGRPAWCVTSAQCRSLPHLQQLHVLVQLSQQVLVNQLWTARMYLKISKPAFGVARTWCKEHLPLCCQSDGCLGLTHH